MEWPHSWEEACKLCSRWTAPDKWVRVPWVHSCRDASATLGSLCCRGLCKRFSTCVCLDIFKGHVQLCFKYLTLYEDVWGFLKLFLWFIKEKESDHTNMNRMIKRPNGNALTCYLFWFQNFICRELLLSLSISLSICIYWALQVLSRKVDKEKQKS